MQDRYTGDIGDYGKLGLLRRIRSAGLTIGVNWYLTPDATKGRDGRYVGYLDQEKFRGCDEELYGELRAIVHSGQRSVQALQNDRILRAKCYGEGLDFNGMNKQERDSFRQEWHKKALAVLAGLDVVFADPDNGLVVPSAKGRPRENKYVLPEELEDYYGQGSSVVMYQHKARRPDEFTIGEQRSLLERPAFQGASGAILKFWPTSQRMYLFFIQPVHREAILKVVEEMSRGEWGMCFTCLGKMIQG